MVLLDLELTAEEYKEDMANMISQMMFVSGETADPPPETTTIIEEIVHTQVVEMVCCFHQTQTDRSC